MKVSNKFNSIKIIFAISGLCLMASISVNAWTSLGNLNNYPNVKDTPNDRSGIIKNELNQVNVSNALGERVWFAGAETGNFSEWDWTGSMDPQNTVFFGTTTERARSGNRSFKIEVNAGDGRRASNMMFLTSDNNVLMRHEELIYTIWLFIPQRVQFSSSNGSPWHNIMQFKMRDEFNRGDPIFTIGFDPWANNRPNYFQLRNTGEWFPNGSSFNYTPIQEIPIPIGQWFKLQVRYKRASNATGRITVWQNDVLIYDINNVVTYPATNRRGARAGRLEWSVNNYARNTIPSITTIFVDDASIHLPDRNNTPVPPATFNLQLNSNPPGAGKVIIKGNL